MQQLKYRIMKTLLKFAAILIALAAPVCASAQKAAVGGRFSVWRDTEDKTTTISVTPDIGYTLSSRWYLGVGIGYNFSDKESTKSHEVSLNPYARYFYYSTGRVRLFVDSTVGFGVIKDEGHSAAFGWQAGFKPGVIIGLTDRFSLAAGFGFLGYRHSDEGRSPLGSDGWGLDVSGNSLSFGFFYGF